MKRLLSVLLCLFTTMSLSSTHAMSAIGVVTMKVIRPLIIESKEPLSFLTATPGSEIDRILPGDPNSGQFLIRGEANMAYQIRLPENIILSNNQGVQENQIIEVKDFTSFPAVNGKLSASGEQTLFIGATRSALRADQEVGSYNGTYTIDIIY